MSPELWLRLHQRARAALRSELRLLGEGVDAIIQHTRRRPFGVLEGTFYPAGFDDRRLPIQPTAQQRLDRYHTAMALFDRGSVLELEIRARRGYAVKARARRVGAQRSNSTVAQISDARRRVERWQTWR